MDIELNSICTQSGKVRRSTTREREELINNHVAENFDLKMRISKLEKCIELGVTKDELKDGKQDRIIELSNKIVNLEKDIQGQKKLLRQADIAIDLVEKMHTHKELQLQNVITEMEERTVQMEESTIEEKDSCCICNVTCNEAQQQVDHMQQTILSRDRIVNQLEIELNSSRRETRTINDKMIKTSNLMYAIRTKQAVLKVVQSRKRRRVRMKNLHRLKALAERIKNLQKNINTPETFSYTTIPSHHEISGAANQQNEELARDHDDRFNQPHRCEPENPSEYFLHLNSEYQKACRVIQEFSCLIQELKNENKELQEKCNTEKLLQKEIENVNKGLLLSYPRRNHTDLVVGSDKSPLSFPRRIHTDIDNCNKQILPQRPTRSVHTGIRPDDGYCKQSLLFPRHKTVDEERSDRLFSLPRRNTESDERFDQQSRSLPRRSEINLVEKRTDLYSRCNPQSTERCHQQSLSISTKRNQVIVNRGDDQSLPNSRRNEDIANKNNQQALSSLERVQRDVDKRRYNLKNVDHISNTSTQIHPSYFQPVTADGCEANVEQDNEFWWSVVADIIMKSNETME